MKKIYLIFFSFCLKLLVYSQVGYTLQYDASGNLLSKTLNGNSPVVTITGDTLVCAGETATLHASSPSTVSYSWHHGATTATVQVQPQQSTIYRVTVTGANGCTSLKTWMIRTRTKPQLGAIVGDTVPFTGINYTYSLIPHQGSFYEWYIQGGNIVSGYGSAQTTINWTGDTTGMLKIVEVNAIGCKSDTLYRPVTFKKTQTIPLQTGWNLVSTFVHPPNPNLPNALQSISGQWAEIRDELGFYKDSVAWAGFNTLTSLTDGQGYWLKAVTPCTLSLTGIALRPSLVHIPLQTGWNLIGYTGQYSKLTQNAFASIMPNIVMIKNTFQSYNPSYPAPFNTLNSIQPGIGYWINVNAPVVFTYPAPDPSGIRIEGEPEPPFGWNPVVYTGSMVGYGKVTLNDQAVEEGDFIGAFVNGECRATAVVNNDMGYSLASMVINGKNEDKVEFRLYHHGQYFISDYYTTIEDGLNKDSLMPLTFRGIVLATNEVMTVLTVYPNPVSDILTIQLQLKEKGGLSLYNPEGKRIFTSEVGGTQTLKWQKPAGLASGVYLLQLSAGNMQWTEKVVVE